MGQLACPDSVLAPPRNELHSVKWPELEQSKAQLVDSSSKARNGGSPNQSGFAFGMVNRRDSRLEARNFSLVSGVARSLITK